MNTSQDFAMCFHVAKLALFNIELLNRLENTKNTDESIRKIIENVWKEKINNEMPPPCLLNQSIYIQFAYICLVWLWESGFRKQDNLKEIFFKNFEKREIHKCLNLPTKEQISGERELQTWKDTISLIRNALSHGKVKITNNSYEFTDQRTKGKNPEIFPTTLSIGWADLAKLSEAVMWSVQELLIENKP